jgi:PPK2 family polyphosphate:nucleotide phosphotransferase
MKKATLIDRYRVPVGKDRIDLDRWDTADDGGFAGEDGKAAAKAEMAEDIKAIDVLQEKLYASRKGALLVVLQAMDTGGKDGAVRTVFGPLNAQGVSVTPFKKPTAEEMSHDFLWRVHKVCPARGEIAVFNRSHYEDVLVVRVHGLASPTVIERRYGQINAFESLLHDAGTRVLKCYLHISKAEQKRRLEARLADPDKHWKFSPADIEERKLWKDYQKAFGIALARCSTADAPWFVIPSDRKWYRSWLLAKLVRRALEDMNLSYPPAAKGLTKLVIPS